MCGRRVSANTGATSLERFLKKKHLKARAGLTHTRKKAKQNEVNKVNLHSGSVHGALKSPVFHAFVYELRTSRISLRACWPFDGFIGSNDMARAPAEMGGGRRERAG